MEILIHTVPFECSDSGSKQELDICFPIFSHTQGIWYIIQNNQSVVGNGDEVDLETLPRFF